MKERVCLMVSLIFIIMLAVLVYPLMAGDYDPLSVPLSTFVQLYSGLGLLTVIPAMLWLLRNIKYPDLNVGDHNLLLKHRIYLKFYFWSTFAVLLISTAIITLFLSFLLGLFLFIALIATTGNLFKKLSGSKSPLLLSYCLPSALGLLPVLLLVFQLVFDEPLTNWSRSKAILNSNEMIAEIQGYRERTGEYPRSLNAVHKDYMTGITGIEKYYYSYDGTTFNVYFEQPRFFTYRLGTREFVVYNPDDKHLMISHAVWHMHFGTVQIRNNQGWYESVETGIPHWKSFLFD